MMQGNNIQFSIDELISYCCHPERNEMEPKDRQE